MAQQPPLPGSIEADIQGSVSGQVAVGSHIVQIGSLHGVEVNLMLPGQQPRPRLRPAPVYLRPRPASGLLDREDEIGRVATALRGDQTVELYGEPGVGKSSLLRRVAHDPEALGRRDGGVVYFSARRLSAADLLQSLFEAFYECEQPFKPTETQTRHFLQDRRALILLDDLELTREQVETVLNAAPQCAFVVASDERLIAVESLALELRGLPSADALALFERELARPLTNAERPAVEALCATLGCHPLRIIQAAGLAREGRRSPVQAARDEPAQTLEVIAGETAAAAKTLEEFGVSAHEVWQQRLNREPMGEEEVSLLGVLALLGVPLEARHLGALAEVKDPEPILESLQQRGFVQEQEERYVLAGDLRKALLPIPPADLPHLPDNASLRANGPPHRTLKEHLDHAREHFTDWAERQRGDHEALLRESTPLLVVLEWGARAGDSAEVLRLGTAIEGALAVGGKWDAWESVLRLMLEAAEKLNNQKTRAWALHQLGTRSLCLGSAEQARALLGDALRLRKELGDSVGAALTQHNLSVPAGLVAAPTLPLFLKLAVPVLLLGVGVLIFLWPEKSAEILIFTVGQAQAGQGGAAQLCYEVRDAKGLRYEARAAQDPGAHQGTGSLEPAEKNCVDIPAPESPTLYRLVATGPDGREVSREFTFGAAPDPPRILSFEALAQTSPDDAGATRYQLCYEVLNASRVEIGVGVGEVDAVGRHCVPVAPTRATDYTLTAVGHNKQHLAQTLTINPSRSSPSALIKSFTATPSRISGEQPGTSVRLCFTGNGEADASLEPGVGKVQLSDEEQCRQVTPTERTTYTLTASGKDGRREQKRVRIEYNPVEVEFLLALPASIKPGETTRLCYHVNEAREVFINGRKESHLPKDIEMGYCISVAPKQTTAYKLAAIGFDDREVSLSTQVRVGEPNLPARIVEFSISPQTVRPGEPALLCYEVHNAANLIVYAVGSEEQRRGLKAEPTGRHCKWIRPTKTTTYVLSAGGYGYAVGGQAVVRVAAGRAGRVVKITRFELRQQSTAGGSVYELCYGFENAESVEITPRLIEGLNPAKSGCVKIDPPDPGGDSFRLTAKGVDGQILFWNINTARAAERK